MSHPLIVSLHAGKTISKCWHFTVCRALWHTFNTPNSYEIGFTSIIPLCKWGPEKLSDSSRVSRPRDTGNEIKNHYHLYFKTSVSCTSAVLQVPHWLWFNPTGVDVCDGWTLLRPFWESNENGGILSKKKKTHICTHTKIVNTISRGNKKDLHP